MRVLVASFWSGPASNMISEDSHDKYFIHRTEYEQVNMIWTDSRSWIIFPEAKTEGASSTFDSD